MTHLALCTALDSFNEAILCELILDTYLNISKFNIQYIIIKVKPTNKP